MKTIMKTDVKPIRILILELVKEGIATHTNEIVLNIQGLRRGIKPHSVRARLSEAVLKRKLMRLEEGVYDIYREVEINSVVKFRQPPRRPDRPPFRLNTS